MHRKCGHSVLKHRCSGSTSDTKGLVQLCNEVLKYSGSPVPCELPQTRALQGACGAGTAVKVGLVG